MSNIETEYFLFFSANVYNQNWWPRTNFFRINTPGTDLQVLAKSFFFSLLPFCLLRSRKNGITKMVTCSILSLTKELKSRGNCLSHNFAVTNRRALIFLNMFLFRSSANNFCVHATYLSYNHIAQVCASSYCNNTTIIIHAKTFQRYSNSPPYGRFP